MIDCVDLSEAGLYITKMGHIEKDLQLTDSDVLLRPYQGGDVSHLYEAARESIAEVSVSVLMSC